MPRYEPHRRGAWLIDDDTDEQDLPPFDFPDELDDDVPSAPARRLSPRASRSKRPAGKQRRSTPVADEDDEPALEFDGEQPRRRDRKRVEVSEGFKCRHCRNFIGIPPSGGRNRNHCPLCLYSLHVDGKTPGDRASDCRSLMQPTGMFYRPNGEQMVVHTCLGCGFVRYNRIAADDNPVVLAELPLVEPPTR